MQLELLDRSVDLIGEGFHIDIRVGVGSGREANLLVQRLAHNWRLLARHLPISPAPAPLFACPI